MAFHQSKLAFRSFGARSIGVRGQNKRETFNAAQSSYELIWTPLGTPQIQSRTLECIGKIA